MHINYILKALEQVLLLNIKILEETKKKKAPQN